MISINSYTHNYHIIIDGRVVKSYIFWIDFSVVKWARWLNWLKADGLDLYPGGGGVEIFFTLCPD